MRALTPRELEVAEMIANECLHPVNIAARLNLSEHTVHTHRANLMRKLKVHSTMELCKWWWEGRVETSRERASA